MATKKSPEKTTDGDLTTSKERDKIKIEKVDLVDFENANSLYSTALKPLIQDYRKPYRLPKPADVRNLVTCLKIVFKEVRLM